MICSVNAVTEDEWLILHWIDNLQIYLDEIPYFPVTGNGKCFPGIVKRPVIVIPFGC